MLKLQSLQKRNSIQFQLEETVHAMISLLHHQKESGS